MEHKYAVMESSVNILEHPAGEPQKPFSLYAVLFAWHEEDIIGACVKNLLAEGVQRVFLIDNGSPDATVERAVQAGASYVRTIHTKYYDESIRRKSVFDCMRSVMKEEGRERIWWLLCDTDEFPTAPGFATIYEYLAQLDDKVRVVGGHWIQHYPMDRPYYYPGFHPAEFQFKATPHHDAAIYCPSVHIKHNLIRFDNSQFDMTIHAGYHRITSNMPLYEDRESLRIHHFQFRDKAHTLERLKALSSLDANGCSRLGDAEFNREVSAGTSKNNKAGYVRRNKIAEKLYAGKTYFEDPPFQWRSVLKRLDHAEHGFSRWYDESALISYVSNHADNETFSTWLLNWTMVYKNGEDFLTRFEQCERPLLSAEHVYYAAQCYCARGEVEKAMHFQTTIENYCFSSLQPAFTVEDTRSYIKDIIMGKALPYVPF